MKYTTQTLSGKELSAEWTGKCIQLTVWNGAHVWIEWAFTMNYAIYRFEWLIEHG